MDFFLKYLWSAVDAVRQKVKSVQKKRKRKIQYLRSGKGPLYHRKYFVEFDYPSVDPLGLIKKAMQDPNHFTNKALGVFEKTTGEMYFLKPGDEFIVHISGPWDGPVKVKKIHEEGFTLITLEGNMEAGEINFRVEETRPSHWRFTIESFARSKDPLVDLVYDKIPIAKIAQTKMWKDYCLNFANYAKPQGPQKVEVITERLKDGEWKRL